MVREVVRLIAQLGGILARKGDGEPSVKFLWPGF
jgi:3,4-dihydroxy-2-butanone 4-phosphate synthase